MCPSSLPQEKKRSSSPLETCPRPRETQDGEPREPDPEQKRSRARERRREGRSKTFDWAEFRPIQQALAQERAGGAPGPPDAHPEAEPGELERERARRREERRKRAEGLGADDAALRMEVDRGPGPPVTTALRTQNVHVEIEQRWHQVETTPLREEKQVPIAPLHLSSEDGGDRLSTHELTSLLEKEVMAEAAGAGRAGSRRQPSPAAPVPNSARETARPPEACRGPHGETDRWTDRSSEGSAGQGCAGGREEHRALPRTRVDHAEPGVPELRLVGLQGPVSGMNWRSGWKRG